MLRFIFAVLLAVASQAMAVERKPFGDVLINELTNDTQRMSSGQGVDLAWWIPLEFWQATFANDPSISEAQATAVLDILRPYFMVAVVQADISPIGAFHFYDRKTIAASMRLLYTGPNNKQRVLKPLSEVDPNMQLLQQQIRPILAAAMGNLGENFYFFTYRDESNGERVVSPYRDGRLVIELTGRKSNPKIDLGIETPLNSLFVPRLCPNGKPAHVTWKVCPWDGTPLKN